MRVQRRTSAQRQALDARRNCYIHGSEAEFDIESILN